MGTSQPDLDFVPNDADDRAADRAKMFRELDPFRSVPCALLSSAEIEDYVRITAMVHPFYPVREFLKSASYEVRPGRKFIRWDKEGNRLQQIVQRGGKYELPPNSISFMQIEPKIRLPDYIAIRFNLRIKHVHRGLLLGTGPLVDPGFSGDLLIPLHNLTSDPYEIEGDEGLIWVEFTKTSFKVRTADPEYVRRAEFRSIEQRKTDVPPEIYFEHANHNNPVKSSIPDAIRRSEERAEAAASSAGAAETSARDANAAVRKQTLWYGAISALAILGGIIGLHQYFAQIQGNVETTHSLAAAINTNANQAKSDAVRAIADSQQLRVDLDRAKDLIDMLERQTADLGGIRTDISKVKEQVDVLKGQLETVTRELESLRQSNPRAAQSTKSRSK